MSPTDLAIGVDDGEGQVAAGVDLRQAEVKERPELLVGQFPAQAVRCVNPRRISLRTYSNGKRKVNKRKLKMEKRKNKKQDFWKGISTEITKLPTY